MKHSFLSVFALIVFVAVICCKAGPPLQNLEAITRQLETPAGLDPRWGENNNLDSIVQSATMAEIRQALPALVSLTESPNEQLRGHALLVLWAISQKKKASQTENQRGIDLAAGEAMVPYISRLGPRLTDSSTQSRVWSFYLFQSLAYIRPTPPELIQAVLTVLKSPQSTQPMPDPAAKDPIGAPSSLGPQILWVLLPAATDFYRDPATRITMGHDSPQVQEAIIQFLHRPDQTTESLSESIRALALAQAQNPSVNAELLPLLNSKDVMVQTALLRYIAKLSLPSESFTAARARVRSIATEPNTPMDLRKIASSLLTCWPNDRYKDRCPDF
jgi:hypothetical protein